MSRLNRIMSDNGVDPIICFTAGRNEKSFSMYREAVEVIRKREKGSQYFVAFCQTGELVMNGCPGQLVSAVDWRGITWKMHRHSLRTETHSMARVNCMLGMGALLLGWASSTS